MKADTDTLTVKAKNIVQDATTKSKLRNQDVHVVQQNTG